MQVIVGPRASGKTTELVERANDQDAHVVVMSEERKKQVEKFYGPENEVYTWHKIEDGLLRGMPKRVMFDDADMLLTYLFRDVHVVGMSVTGEARCL